MNLTKAYNKNIFFLNSNNNNNIYTYLYYIIDKIHIHIKIPYYMNVYFFFIIF